MAVAAAAAAVAKWLVLVARLQVLMGCELVAGHLVVVMHESRAGLLVRPGRKVVDRLLLLLLLLMRVLVGGRLRLLVVVVVVLLLLLLLVVVVNKLVAAVWRAMQGRHRRRAAARAHPPARLVRLANRAHPRDNGQ